jgi:hypothetical protein
MMTKTARFLHRMFKYLLRICGKFHAAWVEARSPACHAVDYFAHAFRGHAKFPQYAPGDTAFLVHQTKQKMLGANVTVASAFRLLVRETQNTPCPLGKSFHACHSFSW